MTSKKTIIVLNKKSLTKYLCIIVLSLVMANLIVNFIKYCTGDRYLYGLEPLFVLKGEENIPSFFSGCLFILSAIFLAIIAKAQKINSNPFKIWTFLSILFLFLAYDELFSVHELLIHPLREFFNASGFFHFAWVIVYGLIVILICILFFPVWLKLNRTVQFWFAFSAITYLSGAVGFEMIGGAYFESINERGDVIYGIIYTIEETLEMVGLILFIYGLMLLLQREFKDIALIISDE